jgi:hypothetical protein
MSAGGKLVVQAPAVGITVGLKASRVAVKFKRDQLVFFPSVILLPTKSGFAEERNIYGSRTLVYMNTLAVPPRLSVHDISKQSCSSEDKANPSTPLSRRKTKPANYPEISNMCRMQCVKRPAESYTWH